MHKIDTDTAVGNEFVDGNAAASVRATRLNAAWFNTIQRELCNVVQDAGIALSQSNDDQLLAALYIVAVKALTERNISGTITISAKGGYGCFGPGSVVFKAADNSAKEFSYNDCLRVKNSDNEVVLSLDESNGLVLGKAFFKKEQISAVPYSSSASSPILYRGEVVPGGFQVTKTFNGTTSVVCEINKDGVSLNEGVLKIEGEVVKKVSKGNLSFESNISVNGFRAESYAAFDSDVDFKGRTHLKNNINIDVPAGGSNGHKKIFHSFQGYGGNILPISSDYTSSGYPLNGEIYNEGDVVFIENTSASVAMQVSYTGANNQNYKVKCNAGQALMFVCRGRTGNKHKFTLVSGTCENVA